VKAAIIGGSGYTGGELARLLLDHPKIGLTQITSRSLTGKYIVNAHPHLRGKTKLKFIHPQQVEPTDILFLAMPHGLSSKNIETYRELGSKIIDLSADFRLSRGDLYEQFYGEPHPHEELLQEFVYGVVEVQKDEMRDADLISSAGCNATASILGLHPLIEAGLDIDHIVVDAKVGTSEGGKDENLGTHHPERSGSIRSYQPTGHRHSAEVIDQFGFDPGQVSFSATALDQIRGVLATIHIFADHDLEEKDLWKIYRKSYHDDPFIRIVKERTGHFRYPDPKLLRGTNYCDLGFEIDPITNRIVIISALDNLMKGAAGQAIQAMNIQQGFDETLGLEFSGLHP